MGTKAQIKKERGVQEINSSLEFGQSNCGALLIVIARSDFTGVDGAVASIKHNEVDFENGHLYHVMLHTDRPKHKSERQGEQFFFLDKKKSGNHYVENYTAKNGYWEGLHKDQLKMVMNNGWGVIVTSYKMAISLKRRYSKNVVGFNVVPNSFNQILNEWKKLSNKKEYTEETLKAAYEYDLAQHETFTSIFGNKPITSIHNEDELLKNYIITRIGDEMEKWVRH